MRRSTVWAAVFLCVACGGRTNSLESDTSDAGGFHTTGGSSVVTTAIGGHSGAGSGSASTWIRGGSAGFSGSGLGGRVWTTGGATGGVIARGGSGAMGGVIARGGSGAMGGVIARGGSGAMGGVIARGGSGAMGGVIARGGSGAMGGVIARGGSSAIGGSTSVLPVCGQLQPGSCEQCLCNACSTQLSACASSSGCAVIAACVVETRCLMMGIGCYSPTTCGTFIDLAGGLESPSAALALQVGMCRITTGCGC
ncbi:MAG: hypothetical protein QM784_13545 [Polyangiaceae bacterium]